MLQLNFLLPAALDNAPFAQLNLAAAALATHSRTSIRAPRRGPIGRTGVSATEATQTEKPRWFEAILFVLGGVGYIRSSW